MNNANNNVSIFHPQVIMGSVILTGSIFTGYKFYSQNLRRLPTCFEIPQQFFRKRYLYGRVTSVGDGDNFHFYHLPGGKLGGWGWLRPLPKVNNFKLNKNQTLHIRLCGVDAPERSHFGKPAQPFSDELLFWLRDYILGKKLWVKPLSIDQYNRIVGKVMIWKWFLYQDVSAQMIKNGIGIVYEGGASSAEFDGEESRYRNYESILKKKRRGLWAGKQTLTPGEYKKLYK